jgi:hypothetical protein
MFDVLAFNALKGTAACFKSVIKCEQFVMKLWNDAITNFHVIEDYKEHVLSHFLTGRLPALFLDYVETMRSIKPSNPVRTLDEWILSNHKDKAGYNQQQKQTIFLGHIILN